MLWLATTLVDTTLAFTVKVVFDLHHHLALAIRVVVAVLHKGRVVAPVAVRLARIRSNRLAQQGVSYAPQPIVSTSSVPES